MNRSICMSIVIINLIEKIQHFIYKNITENNLSYIKQVNWKILNIDIIFFHIYILFIKYCIFIHIQT